jgi:hypothetical protein
MDQKKDLTDAAMSIDRVESRPLGHLTDEERLAQMGHKQELERTFSLVPLTALCLCLMATWEALSTVIAAALASGGPPCLFYN